MRILGVWVLIAMGTLVGCNKQEAEQPPLGSKVTVTYGSEGGWVEGALKKANKDWVVVKRETDDLWIPRDAVALILVDY